MTGNERRQTPRTTLEKLTYINIEPDNGGLVLNLSQEGLCFHSVAPVQRVGRVSFRFPGYKQGIEIGGEVVWTDERQTVGGIRFTTLPKEARQQIHSWIGELKTPAVLLDNGPRASVASPPHAFGALALALRARNVLSAAAVAAAAAFRSRVVVRIPSKGFSSGLAAGLLVSVLLSTAFWLHACRRQLGESLIRWGEQLAPKNPTSVANELPAPENRAPALPPGEYTENSAGNSVGSNRRMYFEVGKFKQEVLARKRSDNLRRLGFPATTEEKGRLGMNSYTVLVGPYSDDEDANAKLKSLRAHGFRPRPFEKGSRNFAFRSRMTLHGTPIPPGDCTISWESYLTDAKVKFLQNGYLVASTGARWVKRAITYKTDAFVYRQNEDRSRTLLEIRLAGMSRVLVLGKAS